jgi:dCMP deaminase
MALDNINTPQILQQTFELEEKYIEDFIKKAAFIANESTCNYKVGACGVVMLPENFNKRILRDTRLGTKKDYLYIKAFNETLAGEIHCQEKDSKGCKICIRNKENLKGKEFEKVCSIHAEQNLIAKCARYNIGTNNMKLFLTNSPCYICAKSIIQAGISEVYYLAEHTDTSGLNLLSANGVVLKKLKSF